MSRTPLLLPLLLVACGGDTYDAQAYWNALGAVHCERMTQCCTADEYVDFLTPDAAGGTQQDCEAMFQTAPDAAFVEDAIARGTIIFDVALAKNCVAVLEILDCAAFQPSMRYRETYCNDPFLGQVADGGACFVDAECVTGNCQGADLRADPPVAGTCQAPTLEGGRCGIGSANCADPFACQAGGVCELGSPPGTACNADFQCADNWCKGDGALADGRCKKACDGQ